MDATEDPHLQMSHRRRRAALGHKVYISFKAEDAGYKQVIQAMPRLDYVDKSLNEPINSQDPEYILERIRSDFLYDSTVTIFLIGEYSAEVRGHTEQYYIKKELQASLYNSANHYKSGILGVVLPFMESTIYGGTYQCFSCTGRHNLVRINDETVIREFLATIVISPTEGARTQRVTAIAS
jgi:hypothetical protein